MACELLLLPGAHCRKLLPALHRYGVSSNRVSTQQFRGNKVTQTGYATTARIS